MESGPDRCRGRRSHAVHQRPSDLVRLAIRSRGRGAVTSPSFPQPCRQSAPGRSSRWRSPSARCMILAGLPARRGGSATFPAATFQGERLRGTISPGGTDWQTLRGDGAIALDARLILKTEEARSQLIAMSYGGIRYSRSKSWPGRARRAAGSRRLASGRCRPSPHRTPFCASNGSTASSRSGWVPAAHGALYRIRRDRLQAALRPTPGDDVAGCGAIRDAILAPMLRRARTRVPLPSWRAGRIQLFTAPRPPAAMRGDGYAASLPPGRPG